MQGHWFFKNGGEKETDDSKEIYINGKQRIKARNRVEKIQFLISYTCCAKAFFLYLIYYCYYSAHVRRM